VALFDALVRAGCGCGCTRDDEATGAAGGTISSEELAGSSEISMLLRGRA